MFQYANQPQSIGKVLDNGIRLCLSSFKQVAAIAFVGAIIAGLPNLFNPAQTATQAVPIGQLKPFFGVLLVAMIIGISFYNAIIFRIDAVATNQAAGVGQALTAGLKKLLPVLLGMILYMLLVSVGSVLLLIPGIILMMSLFFYPALIVVDNSGIIEALKTSHRLVWGNWWRTVTVLMIPAILLMVVYSGLGFIAGVAGLAGGFEPGATAMPKAIMLIGVIVNTIGMPLFYAVMLVQLHDLKLRKQGLDLEQRIEAD